MYVGFTFQSRDRTCDKDARIAAVVRVPPECQINITASRNNTLSKSGKISVVGYLRKFPSI